MQNTTTTKPSNHLRLIAARLGEGWQVDKRTLIHEDGRRIAAKYRNDVAKFTAEYPAALRDVVYQLITTPQTLRIDLNASLEHQLENISYMLIQPYTRLLDRAKEICAEQVQKQDRRAAIMKELLGHEGQKAGDDQLGSLLLPGGTEVVVLIDEALKVNIALRAFHISAAKATQLVEAAKLNL